MHEANENARSEIMCCNYDQLKRSSRNLRIKVHQLPGLQYIVYYTMPVMMSELEVREISTTLLHNILLPSTYFDGANFKFPQLMVVD